MTSRVCPACSRRWAQLIDPTCPICGGSGVLHIGKGVLHHHPPEVVSRAVEYAIEAAARTAIAADPTAGGLMRARERMANTVRTLRLASVLAKEPSPSAGRARLTPTQQHTAAVALTRKLPVDRYHTGDAANLDAPPLEFEDGDRPLAHGGIPGFSAGGYVAHLTRAADPIDPLYLNTADPMSQGTPGVLRHRRLTNLQAKALAEATTGRLW